MLLPALPVPKSASSATACAPVVATVVLNDVVAGATVNIKVASVYIFKMLTLTIVAVLAAPTTVQ